MTPHRHQSNKLYNLVQMPLVGKMMEELVAALPPLADSKVLAFLAELPLFEGFGPAGRRWTGYYSSS